MQQMENGPAWRDREKREREKAKEENQSFDWEAGWLEADRQNGNAVLASNMYVR